MRLTIASIINYLDFSYYKSVMFVSMRPYAPRVVTKNKLMFVSLLVVSDLSKISK